MEPLKPPKTMKVYQLLRMCSKSGLSFSTCGTTPTGANYIGVGFYTTLAEAEHNRTMEVLKDVADSGNSFYVFELEFPNPAANS